MDKKKFLISGLTVAGFLAMSLTPKTASFAIAADETVKQENKEMGKKGSCGAGSCGAMKDKKAESKPESKAGSCSGMKEKKKGDKEAEKKEGKQGSCSAMK